VRNVPTDSLKDPLQGLVKAATGDGGAGVDIYGQFLGFQDSFGQFRVGFNPPGIRPVFRGSDDAVPQGLPKFHLGDIAVFKGHTDPDVTFSIIEVGGTFIYAVGIIKRAFFLGGTTGSSQYKKYC
jgi:hypothetical protein